MNNLHYIMFGEFNYEYMQGYLQALRLQEIDAKYSRDSIDWDDGSEEFIQDLKDGLSEIYWRSL